MNYQLKPEEAECVALVEYLELIKDSKNVIVYSHTAQETYTKSWRQKHRNKSMGVRPGVPDYIIVTDKLVIFLEMKRKKGGRLREDQKVWLEAVEGKKVVSQVCNGFDEAKKFFERTI